MEFNRQLRNRVRGGRKRDVLGLHVEIKRPVAPSRQFRSFRLRTASADGGRFPN